MPIMSKSKKKIVVLGSTNTDMTIHDKRLPIAGETICGGTFKMSPGGKGANQAVAVARLSSVRGGCTFIAKVGDDLFGRDAALRLKREGIDARLIVDEKAASGTALILVDAKGQNVISVALGANGTLSTKDVAPLRKEIENASALLLQLETPVATVLAAAQWAHAAGVPVILNPAPAAKLPKALYACLDWITPNETEAEFLTGVAVTDAASAKRASAVLRRRGVRNVLITMGAHGCYCDVCGKLFPRKKIKSVDCVAAGDTFNGAFVVALAEGRDVAAAIDFAQKASAISVTRRGAQDSIPFRREVR